jgi:hypothetical protein
MKMTINESLTTTLINHGLFPEQASEVMRRVRENSDESMQNRWYDEVEGYPPQLLNILLYTAKQEALDYIDETCPKAWFRPLLET